MFTFIARVTSLCCYGWGRIWRSRTVVPAFRGGGEYLASVFFFAEKFARELLELFIRRLVGGGRKGRIFFSESSFSVSLYERVKIWRPLKIPSALPFGRKISCFRTFSRNNLHENNYCWGNVP